MYAVQPPGYHPGESNWQDHRYYLNTGNRCGLHTAPPCKIRNWLLNPGSLTRRLIKVSNNQFSVQVLKQQWERPRLSEVTLLGMRSKEVAIIREVALLCADKPWVFARSVMPASSLTGHLYGLRKFADSSLGELLFRDKSMRRLPFQLAIIDGNSTQIPAHLRQSQMLWGRRCRFELANKPIMVSEIFLPAFCP